MILQDPSAVFTPWRGALRDRLARALGDRAADEPWAVELAGAVAHFLEARAGARAVRDEDLDAVLGEALYAVGRAEAVPRLLQGGAGGDPESWRTALPIGALRTAALRRWARPGAGETRRGAVWTLDLRRLFRDDPSGLDLGRFRLLGAVLDALAESVAPERGLDALAVRPPRTAGRRATAIRAEIRAFCRARLAAAAAKRAWPRPPDVVWADLRG